MHASASGQSLPVAHFASRAMSSGTRPAAPGDVTLASTAGWMKSVIARSTRLLIALEAQAASPDAVIPSSWSPTNMGPPESPPQLFDGIGVALNVLGSTL